MATYLTISVGDRPQQAKPILASDDRRVIQAALDALLQRAGVIELSHRGGDAKDKDSGREE